MSQAWKPEHLDSVRKHVWLWCTLFLTFVIYFQVRSYGYVPFDDNQYIYENPWVKQGLTWKGFLWAFQADWFSDTPFADYWQPVTFLSRMIDVQLFGLNPGASHLINLGFHLANIVLVYFLIRRITQSSLQTGCVTLLFAIHPMNAESVVWITERKDVLSLFFGLLTFHFYLRYLQNPRWKTFLAMHFLFALSLMSKAMMISLPPILLLTDILIIKRFHSTGLIKGLFASLAEKTGLILMTLFSLWITIVGMKSQLMIDKGYLMIQYIPFALASYPGMFLFPHSLKLHVIPNDWMIEPGLWLPCILIVGIWIFTVKACWNRRPEVSYGLSWALIALLPVCAMPLGNRFLYFPMIGFTLTLSYLIEKGIHRYPHGNTSFILPVGTWILYLIFQTWTYLPHWKSADSFLGYFIKMNPKHWVLLNNQAFLQAAQGKESEAMKSYWQGIQVRPYNDVLLFNYANLISKNHPDVAARFYRKTIDITPGHPGARINLALIEYRSGQLNEAGKHLQEILNDDPSNTLALYNLGAINLKLEKWNEAAIAFKKAAQWGHEPSRLQYITLLESNVEKARSHGDYKTAEEWLIEIVSFSNEKAEARYNLGNLYLHTERYSDAITQYLEALKAKPSLSDAHHNLGITLDLQGMHDDALLQLNQAIELEPMRSLFHLTKSIHEQKYGSARNAYQEAYLALELDPDNLQAKTVMQELESAASKTR